MTRALQLLLVLAVAALVGGCGEGGLARHNRAESMFAVGEYEQARPWLAEIMAEWQVAVNLPEGDLPDEAELAAYPIGNGEVFALTGLKHPLGTLENIMGPTYQKGEVVVGDIVPFLYSGPTTVHWDRQTVSWIRPGGIVRTESATAEGLKLTLYDFALPGRLALVRLAVVSNEGQETARRLALAHAFTAVAIEGTRDEVMIGGPHGARSGFLDSRSQVVTGVEAPWRAEDRRGRLLPLLREDAPILRCPLGNLEPGESIAKIGYLVFTSPEDDGSETLAEMRELGWDLPARAHQYWQERAESTAQLKSSSSRLDDFLQIQKYLVQVQQAAPGGFSPMHAYTRVWIRDSNGPVQYMLAVGDYESVRRYLDYQYRGYAVQGSISNNLALNLDLPQEAPQVDWDQVQVPGSEISSFMILQRYWYWRHTGDAELLREQWPMLRRCLEGQQVDERGVLRYFGDETYRFPGYELFNAGQPAPHYVHLSLPSLDSTMEYVVAAEAMAEMAVVAGYPEETSGYRAEAEKSRAAIERYFWQADREYYAPAISDLSEQQHRSPFAPVNLHLLWMGYGAAQDRLLSNLEQTLRLLAKPSGTVLTTPEFGPYVPLTLAYELKSLALAGHPARDHALQGMLNAAEKSGGFAEMITEEDKPATEIWGWRRVRPWEGGLNAESVLHAVTGLEVDVPRSRVRLSPWLPEGVTSWEAGPLVAGESRLRVRMTETSCTVTRLDTEGEPLELEISFLTGSPVPALEASPGTVQTVAAPYGQRRLRVTGLRLGPGEEKQLRFSGPLRPVRGKLPEREQFVWGGAEAGRLRPVVLVTWDERTLEEQRQAHGASLTVVDSKISWPTEYLRSYLAGPDGSRRARILLLDVAGFPGAFKRDEYWQEGEGAKLVSEFEAAGGQVVRLQTGRTRAGMDHVPDI